MKLFRATLVLWLIAILRRVSGEAGKSSHQTTERCFNSRINHFQQAVKYDKFCHAIRLKDTQTAEPNKIKKKTCYAFFRDCAPTGCYHN